MTPNDQRLVLIEDATELRPLQPNHVSLVASRREDSERSAADHRLGVSKSMVSRRLARIEQEF